MTEPSEKDRERARVIVSDPSNFDSLHFEDDIAAALAEARSEQREADAKIAEAADDGGDCGLVAQNIAEAIRRGEGR